MRALYLIVATCVAFAAPAAPDTRRNQPAPQAKASPFRQLSVLVPMRDGVRLSANVFLPSDRSRGPVILERTPYGKGAGITPLYAAFVELGYAVVAQDVRGRYQSEGVFQPLVQETEDGEDTLNWIARQSWSDGRVGMIGGSYRGIVQWKVAILNNPHLKAIFPVVSGYDDYRDRFYSPGGAMKIGNRLGWMAENLKVADFHPDFSKYTLHLPLRTADIAATGRTSEMFQSAVAHPVFDSFWRAISVKERIKNIRIPVFAVGGWYDNFVQSDLEAYAALRQSNGQNRLVIGPWAHNPSYKFPDADFGPDSQIPIRGLQLAWFDRFLMGKNSPLFSQPPLKLFIMGANRWREEREWPPEGARPRSFYLQSDGRANSLDGDGVLTEEPPRRAAHDRFVYDPASPVPTRGGAVCCNPRTFPWGPMDQRSVEKRKDVLVYTSKPLKKDLEVIGPVSVILHASTNAKDTDFTAKLVDVFPDGYARNLTDGILRLRYRNSLEKTELARPGQTYRITIDAGVTGNVFLKGHRIRLEISSSNFPRFDRNSNTGGRIATETDMRKANQTVYHGGGTLSQLVLMVAPDRPEPPAVEVARVRPAREKPGERGREAKPPQPAEFEQRN